MSDLTSDIYLSQSALSRAVARLESDGLVHRSMCTDDRRAIFVCLTDAGATCTRTPGPRTARCSGAPGASEQQPPRHSAPSSWRPGPSVGWRSWTGPVW